MMKFAERMAYYVLHHLPKELLLALVAAVMYEYLHEALIEYLHAGGAG